MNAKEKCLIIGVAAIAFIVGLGTGGVAGKINTSIVTKRSDAEYQQRLNDSRRINEQLTAELANSTNRITELETELAGSEARSERIANIIAECRTDADTGTNAIQRARERLQRLEFALSEISKVATD